MINNFWTLLLCVSLFGLKLSKANDVILPENQYSAIIIAIGYDAKENDLSIYERELDELRNNFPNINAKIIKDPTNFYFANMSREEMFFEAKVGEEIFLTWNGNLNNEFTLNSASRFLTEIVSEDLNLEKTSSYAKKDLELFYTLCKEDDEHSPTETTFKIQEKIIEEKLYEYLKINELKNIFKLNYASGIIRISSPESQKGDYKEAKFIDNKLIYLREYINNVYKEESEVKFNYTSTYTDEKVLSSIEEDYIEEFFIHKDTYILRKKDFLGSRCTELQKWDLNKEFLQLDSYQLTVGQIYDYRLLRRNCLEYNHVNEVLPYAKTCYSNLEFQLPLQIDYYNFRWGNPKTPKLYTLIEKESETKYKYVYSDGNGNNYKSVFVLLDSSNKIKQIEEISHINTEQSKTYYFEYSPLK